MAPKLIVICGPTATGKTKLGVALAQRLGEVVSADSMQVYRDMAIGTARPTPEEMAGVPHHMMGVVDPRENYSVARYVQEATAWVEDILRRGKRPSWWGAQGCTSTACARAAPIPTFSRPAACARPSRPGSSPRDWQCCGRSWSRWTPRRRPSSTPHDEKRILRALEVWHTTGKPISQHNRETQALPPRYEKVAIALTYRDRQVLYQRIDQRVDQMVARGLVEEVQGLLNAGVPLDGTAMQAIGYKELARALTQGGDLAQAVEEVKRRSRQYAKRQLTWFRRDPNIEWIFAGKGSRLFQRHPGFDQLSPRKRVTIDAPNYKGVRHHATDTNRSTTEKAQFTGPAPVQTAPLDGWGPPSFWSTASRSGEIRGFDAFVVVIYSEGKRQMVYKHAISTVVPERPLSWEEDPAP